MARDYVIRGLPLGPVADILPPEFDPDLVTTFFAGGEKAVAEKFPDVAQHGAAHKNRRKAKPALVEKESETFEAGVMTQSRRRSNDGPAVAIAALEDVRHVALYADEFVFS
jgi:hypothetical protein